MIDSINVLIDIIDTYNVDELSINELIVLDEKLEQIKRYIAIMQSDITKTYKLLKISVSATKTQIINAFDSGD